MPDEKIGPRMKKLRLDKGLSQRAFAELTSNTQGVISNAENEVNVPNASVVTRILVSFPDLSARWLLTGEGSMWESEGPPSHARAQGFPGVDVERLTVLARRAGNLALWRVWRLLGEEGPLGLKDLEAAFPDEDPQELAADLMVAEEYGFLRRVETPEGPAFEAGTGILRSRNISELSQLGLEALHELTEIITVLSATPDRARLAAASLRVPAGMGREAMLRLWSRWREAFMQESQEPGDDDELSMVLGIAMTSGAGDAKLSHQPRAKQQ